jgi:thymidylate synthase
MRFDLSKGFPLVTTKKVHLKSIIHELLWFIRGESNIQYLKDNGVSIWNEWADANGELGPVYGVQWRSWTAPNGEKIDQLKMLLDNLRKNPDSRRHIVSAWNVGELSKMALPPCHYSWQVWTAELSVEDRFDLWNIKRKITNPEDIFRKQDVNEEDWEMFLEGIPKRKISLLFNARSQDVPLGTPYNIVSYAMLLLMLADEVNMIPDRLIGNLGDCHIYENQMNGVEEQLKRFPRKFPTLKVKNGINAQFEDFELIGYDPHPKIHFPLS